MSTSQQPDPVASRRADVVSSDDVRISIRQQGDAETALLFVHGLSCAADFWRQQIVHFSGHYACVALDLAGHGASGKERADWTVAAFAEDVAAVVRYLARPTILIGHSLGGPVCVETALRFPRDVVGVIGVESFHWFGMGLTQEKVRQLVEPFAEDYLGTLDTNVRVWFPADADPSIVAWVIKRMAQVPAKIAIDALEHLLAWYLDRGMQPLRQLRVPLRVINSKWLSREVSEDLRRAGIAVCFIEEAGHFPMLERPASFNEMLGIEITRVLESAGLGLGEG